MEPSGLLPLGVSLVCVHSMGQSVTGGDVLWRGARGPATAEWTQLELEKTQDVFTSRQQALQ